MKSGRVVARKFASAGMGRERATLRDQLIAAMMVKAELICTHQRISDAQLANRMGQTKAPRTDITIPHILTERVRQLAPFSKSYLGLPTSLQDSHAFETRMRDLISFLRSSEWLPAYLLSGRKQQPVSHSLPRYMYHIHVTNQGRMVGA